MLHIVLGAGAGALAGSAMWRWLRTGHYRSVDDTPRRDLRSCWLVVPAAAVAGALAGWCPGALAPAAWIYLVGGVLVTWIDLDVHRVPDGVLRLWTPLLVVAVVGAAAATDDLRMLVAAVGGAGALGALFLVLALVGSMGLGDVKLAAVTGLFTGALGWPFLATAVVLGFLAAAVAGAWLLTRGSARTAHLAFGPAIVVGAAAAVIRFGIGT